MSPRLSTGDEHYAGEPTNFIYNSIYFTLTFHFHIILIIIFSQLFDIKQVLFKTKDVIVSSFQASPAILCLIQNLVKVIGLKDFDHNIQLLFLVNQV